MTYTNKTRQQSGYVYEDGPPKVLVKPKRPPMSRRQKRRIANWTIGTMITLCADVLLYMIFALDRNWGWDDWHSVAPGWSVGWHPAAILVLGLLDLILAGAVVLGIINND